MADQQKNYQKVRKDEIVSFCKRCLVAAGLDALHAEQLADVLLAADCRGHYSHGLNKLLYYMKDLRNDACKKDGSPVLLKESVATAYVDGQNVVGPVVGNFCMDLAIKKAKEVGVGWVVAKGSNHYGIAGYYPLKAIKQGLIGMSMTNTSPICAPTRSKTPFLGTNPLSVAAPAQDGDSFYLDMATTTVALGKLAIQKHKGEPIPDNWAQDKDGKPTNDPKDVLDRDGFLLSLGGSEISGGYKGSGLGCLVELFCGVMADSNFGPNIKHWKDREDEANLAQMFVAIDPNCFGDGFEGRLKVFLDMFRNLEPADPEKEVMVAGDPERKCIDKVEKDGGVTYHASIIKQSNEIADSMGVAHITTF